MNKSHLIKKEQLGMHIGTASNRLRKMIILNLIQKLNLDKCFRCEKRITNFKELSIDHKENWLHSSNPKALFFDIENIAYSHLSCNCMAGSQPRKKGCKRNPSRFRGVSRADSEHKNKPWQARIHYKRKLKNLGYFESQEEAAKVFDKEFIKLGGNPDLTNKGLGKI